MLFLSSVNQPAASEPEVECAYGEASSPREQFPRNTRTPPLIS